MKFCIVPATTKRMNERPSLCHVMTEHLVLTIAITGEIMDCARRWAEVPSLFGESLPSEAEVANLANTRPHPMVFSAKCPNLLLKHTNYFTSATA